MTTKTESLKNIQCTTSRVVANNTFMYTAMDTSTVFRLHMTDIVTIKPDDSYILNSGGWRTVTTKERINRYLPGGVALFSVKGVWKLFGQQWCVLFEDGMVIPADRSKPKVQWEKQHTARLRTYQKQIKAYTDKMKGMIAEGNLPKPEIGDCFFCMAEPGQEARLSHKNPLGNNDHIIQHLKEKYVHGHLIFNAMIWAGYRPEQMPYVYGGDQAVRAVRRYLKFRVGLA